MENVDLRKTFNRQTKELVQVSPIEGGIWFTDKYVKWLENEILAKVNGVETNNEKALHKHDVNVSVADVRKAFADYHESEGCSCCQDVEAHDKAYKRLGELLKADAYDDGSSFDWSKYATES